MHVLIAGGGIAGCATALALRFHGITSEIAEARDSASDGTGAFLTLAVNGVRMLRRVGVDPDAVGGIPTPTMRISLGNGDPLTEFPLGDGTLTVRRADLYRVLRSRVEELGIPIRYDRRLAAATESDDVVTAEFVDGSTASADLLVGADGIGSRVRALLDPRAPRARYLGLLNTGGFAHGLEVPGRIGRMEMVFGRRTFFSYLPGPTGEVWWFANPSARTEPARHELGVVGLEEWRARVLDLVRDDDPLLGRIVEATPTADLFSPWPMHDFPRVPVWRGRRTVLVGDAAHAASPSSGQGASLALEDAVALAALLASAVAESADVRSSARVAPADAERAPDLLSGAAPADAEPSGAMAEPSSAARAVAAATTAGSRVDAAALASVLERYEHLRRPRVERVVAQGKRSSSGKAPGPLGARIRDAFMRRYFATPRPATDQSWLWDYDLLADLPRTP